MTEGYYNVSAHGAGIEGFMNWANLSVDGWMVSAFLFFIWLSFVYVGSKSTWKMPGIMAFSFFTCLIASMIFKLFTVVNPTAIFVIIFGLAGSLFWMVIEK